MGNMKINDTNNYSALIAASEKGGWCYSIDSKNIKVAITFKEKFYFALRTIFFSNGNDKTLKSAIIGSFSAVDQALIKAELKDHKIIKKNIALSQNFSIDEETALLKPRDADKLLSEVLKSIQTEKLIESQPSQEVSLKELESLSKIHRVLGKIHTLAEKVEKNRAYAPILKNKIQQEKQNELRNLIRTIANSTPGLSSFQRNFYRTELENAEKSTPKGIVRDQLKEFHTNQFECAFNNPKNDDVPKNMNRLIVYMNKVNGNKDKINDALYSIETPSEDLLALKEVFNFECIDFKTKLIKETVQAVMDQNTYATFGRNYGLAITMHCVAYIQAMSSEDHALFNACMKDHIKNCEMIFKVRNGQFKQY